ncbi:MAG: N-6 DNA methylase [Bacteroidales bacterium]|nr:N-6 DNA methylase [Bacteroidales bacterium]
MERIDIVDCVGRKYCTSNIEGGEFSYKQVLENVTQKHFKLDIRFYDATAKVAVLIETKQKFAKKDEKQLFDYVSLEQRLSSMTKIIAMLANTNDNKIKVWKIANGDVEELDDKKLKSFEEYVDYFKPKNINDKTTVLENTSKLNRLLHDNGIAEKLRSQFVGTCLLALKNGLNYRGLGTAQIIAGIKEVLGSLLEGSVDKADKIVILHENILKDQNVEKIKSENFEKILSYIETNIEPYINESSREGHDILSYFFTTFNKYVAREDKNQAFTPNHISHFMAKVAGIYKTSRILDPTCGSGTFLVQAMTQALNDCETDSERNEIKKHQIYGIEFDKNVYGLSTTNMLIHGDGNSNIRCGSCFEKGDWIKQANADVVLMNPPYNASKNQVTETFAKTWGKTSTDPSKGFCFVEFVADKVNRGRLLTLLPMACAIQTDGVIGGFKQKMLEKHSLDAVFSFPAEMFYPGASAVACCMVFDLGKPHKKDKETFFGYFKDDGFEKRKGVGRVDIRDKWQTIEKEWLSLYEHRSTVAGKSVNRHVEANEEWCAEAYMETDYSTLCNDDFIRKMRDYAAFLISCSNPYRIFNYTNIPLSSIKKQLDTKDWKWFKYNNIFGISGSKTTSKDELLSKGPGEYPYVTTQAINNGIEAFYDYYTEKGNVLVVDSAVLGFCSYQEKKFSASDHVEVLTPLFKMNIYIAQFLVTLINKEQYRYNYGRKCSQIKLKASKLKLPAIQNAQGEYEPDWQWMEDYIKGLPYSGCLNNTNREEDNIRMVAEERASYGKK